MKQFVPIILFVFSMTSALAIERLSFSVGPYLNFLNSSVKLEVVTVYADGDNEIKTAVQFAHRYIYSDKLTNSEVDLNVIIALPEQDALKKYGFQASSYQDSFYTNEIKRIFSPNLKISERPIPLSFFDIILEERSPSAEDHDKKLNQARAEFMEYYKSNHEKRRVVMTIIRGIGVGGVTTSTLLYVSELPLGVSIEMGVLTFILSGTMHYYTKELMDFYQTNSYSRKFKKLFNISTENSHEKRSPFPFYILKWYSTEIIYLTIYEFVAFTTGAFPILGIDGEIGKILSTAGKTCASQGIFECGVNRDFNPRIDAAALGGDFETASRLLNRTQWYGIVGSFVWAAAAISSMMGVSIGILSSLR